VPHDPKLLEAALAPLVGLPLWATHRAADLQSFQFGAQHTVTSRFGPNAGSVRTVGDFALHVQCSWRISRADGSSVPDAEGWLRDRSYLVESVAADATGGFRLTLADGFILEAVPDSSDHGELWRLFAPAKNRPHFVVETSD
jgi:hypothetical protein